MNNTYFTLLTVIAVIIVSIKAFKDYSFKEKLLFDPFQILAKKEWYRIITSGFIHADTAHIVFNAMTLILFGQVIEETHGSLIFLLIFFTSIIGGNLLSLFVHRHHHYRALGASGGTSGLVIAYVILCPNAGVGMLLLPGIYLPGFVYALLFFTYSIYSAHYRYDNIGHYAHIGGGVSGLILSMIIFPQAIALYPLETIGLLLFLLGYLFYLVKSKGGLIPFSVFVKSPVPSKKTGMSFKMRKPKIHKGKLNQMQKEIKVVSFQKHESELDQMDELLKQISEKGIDSLNSEQRRILERASQRFQDRKK